VSFLTLILMIHKCKLSTREQLISDRAGHQSPACTGRWWPGVVGGDFSQTQQKTSEILNKHALMITDHRFPLQFFSKFRRAVCQIPQLTAANIQQHGPYLSCDLRSNRTCTLYTNHRKSSRYSLRS